MSSAINIRPLIELRRQLAEELQRKKNHLEGFEAAMRLMQEAEDSIAENAQPLIERGEANASEPDPPQGS